MLFYIKTIPLKTKNQLMMLHRLSFLNFNRNFSYLASKHFSKTNNMNESLKTNDSEFRILEIPGWTKLEKEDKKVLRRKKRLPPPPRSNSLPMDSDWTDVWPTASSFKWSVVPLPIRQGYVKRMCENEGIVPGKYANAELMKIPNFFHLTPAHIKKHSIALKPFFTNWPKELDTDEKCRINFPIKVITRDYIKDGHSLRDERSRLVTLIVALSDLKLDDHAADKLKRILGNRYDDTTDLITIETDACPLKKQNFDYAFYLLSTAYSEAWRTDKWEEEITEEDRKVFRWEYSKGKDFVQKTVSSQVSTDNKDLTEKINNYGSAVADIFNIGESVENYNKMKDAAKQLLNLR